MRIVLFLLSFIMSISGLAAGMAHAQSAPKIPDANGVTILVRTTIIALDQANRTGNYTVFRDLGSPGFQTANTAAKLAIIFANLRAKKLNLGPIAVVAPVFTKKPVLTKQGMLQLTGYFPTRPLRVNFDLIYRLVGGRWLLFGIAAQANPAPTTQADPEPAEER